MNSKHKVFNITAKTFNPAAISLHYVSNVSSGGKTFFPQNLFQRNESAGNLPKATDVNLTACKRYHIHRLSSEQYIPAGSKKTIEVKCDRLVSGINNPSARQKQGYVNMDKPRRTAAVTASVIRSAFFDADVNASAAKFLSKMYDAIASEAKQPQTTPDVIASVKEQPQRASDVTASAVKQPQMMPDVTASVLKQPQRIPDVTASVLNRPQRIPGETSLAFKPIKKIPATTEPGQKQNSNYAEYKKFGPNRAAAIPFQSRLIPILNFQFSIN